MTEIILLSITKALLPEVIIFSNTSSGYKWRKLNNFDSQLIQLNAIKMVK